MVRDAPLRVMPPTVSPALSPSQPPSPAATHKMIASIFMALLLPCAGMSLIFLIYISLLWYSTARRVNHRLPAKPAAAEGLSASELERIPRVMGREVVAMGRTTECAVCLEELEEEQPARLVPGCNHGFHVHCADAWLAHHSVCPLCRSHLQPSLNDDAQRPPC